MKKNMWKIMIAAGIIPLILPFVLGVYHTMIESWMVLDWVILYSYLYWPTYVLGTLLIVAGVVVWRRRKRMLLYRELELEEASRKH